MKWLFLILFLILSGCHASRTPAHQHALIDNAAITAQVQMSLFADPHLAELPVVIKTSRGVVQVSGVVFTAAQRQQIIDILAAIPDIKGTIVRLEIYPRRLPSP